MLIFLLSLLVSFSQANTSFPQIPDQRFTVGSLCQEPNELRYPERIKYCRREVSTEQKAQIIQIYEKSGGYEIMKHGRENFKIDHYVPLCMGGSNEARNLWPQHKSIYTYTDPLEQVGCQKLSQGKVKQARVIELLIQAKKNPAHAQEVYQILMAL